MTLLLPPLTRLIRSAEGVGLVATARQDPPRSKVRASALHEQLRNAVSDADGGSDCGVRPRSSPSAAGVSRDDGARNSAP